MANGSGLCWNAGEVTCSFLGFREDPESGFNFCKRARHKRLWCCGVVLGVCLWLMIMGQRQE